MFVRILSTFCALHLVACAVQTPTTDVSRQSGSQSPPSQQALSQPNAPAESSTGTLLKQLQHGGFVIFFRHASTDHSQTDNDMSDLSNCAAQRNLDDNGRHQAEIIGEQFKTLNIPVGVINTSRLCRCIDTAKLAFGRATPIQDLTSIVGVTQMVRKQRSDAIKSMLTRIPESGTNTVLVSHKFMFHDASDVWLEEGQAAIYKPAGNGNTKLVSKVKPDEWQNLVSRASK